MCIRDRGYDVLGVGKIEDIFNHRGLTSSNHAAGNEACVDAILDYIDVYKRQVWGSPRKSEETTASSV